MSIPTTPIQPLPYNSEVPNVSLDEVRQDFFDIWQTNLTIVEQWRENNSMSGNYGSDDEEIEWLVSKELRLNIQGAGTDAYTRERYGIDTTSNSWHCYALHTEDIKNNDRIIWNGSRFMIKNLNQSTHEGNLVFLEFDLRAIDKDSDSFYNNGN